MEEIQYRILLLENKGTIIFEKIVNSLQDEDIIVEELIDKLNKNREVKVFEKINNEWKLRRVLSLKK
ncbi:hypothetical protein H3N56_11025 [Cetobacterium sp. 2A]|uniref:hypothetical protein n=1 Tax=Cetobacterium sp. 2A TaxID=2754723 RepID=UPI00163C1BB8|nr:hypothetical protein [Cetobacterium sp. 2A]MBC2855334.1 hypothetical protein [Cetobacterium sp. 2A]MBC2855340.1 hypothetical protein [Cetobacterium sp. 2A]MBC2855404.1 hypothetical protein [Cetobacterium sp. 2A]MBC2856966.1 hypothetical protein [Cetobacterium sp. 2A]